MKSKIVFDTNFLWKDHQSNIGDVFNTNLENIIDFVDKHNKEDIIIAVPQVVVEERLTQQTEQIYSLADRTSKAVKELVSVGLKIDFPKQSPKIKETLRKKTDKYLNDKSVEKIAVPTLDQEDLLKRAYERTHPFTKSDKGFKDTILWLSILEDAKNNSKTDYLLCTKNKEDFDFEKLNVEFKRVSKATLVIVDSPQDIKEHLDNKYKLQLELKKRYAEIEAEIKSRIGELMYQLNVFAAEQGKPDPYGYSIMADDVVSYRPTAAYQFGHEIPSGSSFWKMYSGFTFSNMDIQNISELRNDTFKVDIDLQVVGFPKDKEKKRDDIFSSSISVASDLTRNAWYPGEIGDQVYERHLMLSVSLNYDFKEKRFIIAGAVPAYLLNQYPY